MNKDEMEMIKQIRESNNRGLKLDHIYFLNGVQQQRQYPSTFKIPSDMMKDLIQVGDGIRVSFRNTHNGLCESMWLGILSVNNEGIFYCVLESTPFIYEGLISKGNKFQALPEHVIEISKNWSKE